MVVGDNIAILRNDNTRTKSAWLWLGFFLALLLLLFLLAVVIIVVASETRTKEEFKRIKSVASLEDLLLLFRSLVTLNTYN
jgi:hypothetical protein